MRVEGLEFRLEGLALRVTGSSLGFWNLDGRAAFEILGSSGWCLVFRVEGLELIP